MTDELAVGVASDCAEQHFYWTDVTNGRVSRAGIDGLDQEVVAQGEDFVFIEVLLKLFARQLFAYHHCLSCVVVMQKVITKNIEFKVGQVDN